MPQNQTRVEEANSELNSPQELEHEPAPQSTLSTGARFGQLARRANTTHTHTTKAEPELELDGMDPGWLFEIWIRACLGVRPLRRELAESEALRNAEWARWACLWVP